MRLDKVTVYARCQMDNKRCCLKCQEDRSPGWSTSDAGETSGQAVPPLCLRGVRPGSNKQGAMTTAGLLLNSPTATTRVAGTAGQAATMARPW